MLFWVGILPLARSEEVSFEGEGGIEARGVSEDGCGELRPSRDEPGLAAVCCFAPPWGRVEQRVFAQEAWETQQS